MDKSKRITKELEEIKKAPSNCSAALKIMIC